MGVDLIPAGRNLDSDHPDISAYANATPEELRTRWTSENGRAFVTDWASASYDRSFLESNVGRFFGKVDLRGIDLAGKNLARKDLSGCDLFAALLRHTQLVQSNLDSSYFSEADIRGADLSWSSARDAFFDNVIFDQSTKLLGVPLQSVNFNLAALLYDQARTEQRIAHLKTRSPWFAAFLEWSCDYGRSFGRWGMWALFMIVVHATAFYVVRGGFKGISGFGDAVYFSLVTFTTVGFGDIVPESGFAKILTLSDIVTGYVMGGLLVAILAKRVLGE